MLATALVLTNEEAAVLRRVLEDVKTRTFEDSQINLDDLGALNVLASHFKDAEKTEPKNDALKKPVDSLGKRLFLGHIIGREGSTDTASGSQG